LEQYAAAKNQPYPRLQVQLSGAVFIAAGASVALGVKPQLGAASLLAFLGVITTTMHAFWNEEDPDRMQNGLIQFSKNIALVAAATAFAGVS
jgi:uncharacterized membrane protein YphA (DoxX/SURF4 family)